VCAAGAGVREAVAGGEVVEVAEEHPGLGGLRVVRLLGDALLAGVSGSASGTEGS
jgi:hypothetical protein